MSMVSTSAHAVMRGAAKLPQAPSKTSERFASVSPERVTVSRHAERPLQDRFGRLNANGTRRMQREAVMVDSSEVRTRCQHRDAPLSAFLREYGSCARYQFVTTLASPLG
jgi:hypothetical protein